MKNKIFFSIGIITCLIFSNSCSQILDKKTDRQRKRIEDKVDFIRKTYGVSAIKKDTITYDNSLVGLYQNGKLIEIGEMRHAKRKGEWFLFDDSLKLKYVLNYKKNKSDTLHKPFILINRSW